MSKVELPDENLTDTQVMDLNMDKTFHNKTGTYRKPLGGFSLGSLEAPSLFDNAGEPTYAFSILKSLFNGFSSVFEWDGLPEGLHASQIEKKLLQSGRIKIIKVGTKYLAVNISPIKYDYMENVIESLIIEPWLPKLTGKKTETFKNVEIRNNNTGTSLTRLIYPFLKDIDTNLFNLSDHLNVLAGKFVYMSDDKTSNDNDNLSNALNCWIKDRNPVKVVQASMLDKDSSPLVPLTITDSVQSYIDAIKFAENKLLNIIGIPNNNNEDKKERLITNEINIQNILQSSILDDMLKYREMAIEKINKEFGLSIRVKLKEALIQKIKENGVDETDNKENKSGGDE